MPRMATTLTDGFLLVDKPAGVSSHDVVATVRRARGGIKAGHTGTLDPFATGLLLVALGRATRLIRFVPAEPKVYHATIRFGTATDTDDATGAEVDTAPAPVDGVVRDAVATLTGTIEQRPPAYSARHVGGRRAYELARKGETPDLAPTTVTVETWEIESFVEGTLNATITCSAGTYIRALARDLGTLCGSVAHLAALRRTRIGPFDVRDAVTPGEAQDAQLRSCADTLSGMIRQVVDPGEVAHVHHGRSVAARVDGARAALVDEAGELVAVADREGERWHPSVVVTGG
jgi:tRNA pseudouridine55 synthase